MRCVMVMFDTLCRRFLPPYGNDWVHAPNFRRLAARTAQFQHCYVGSMPCMPARRELHTGRYNFLHRSWGPLEPFDDSVPELLDAAGVHTHQVTDHYHYWEDGGATYHNRFRTFAFVRGQEGDPYIGHVAPIRPEPQHPDWTTADPRSRWYRMRAQDWINRRHQTTSEQQPMHLTFSQGIDHIRRNAGSDRWFLQLETFDPHEPFFTQQRFKDLYPHAWDGPTFDWPGYSEAKEPRAWIEHVQYEFAALISFCDEQLGRILDLFDELDLWRDTALIVNTDHGFLMGEHDWWAKCRMPFWQEIAHIPLWIWDPRSRVAGVQRQALVQTIDLAPTILGLFDVAPTPHMQGRDLARTVAADAPVRAGALYGIHGGHVNYTDGRHVYMRGPVAGAPHAAEYTLMPTHMASRFAVEELQDWQRHPGFAFTKGCGVMRVPGRNFSGIVDTTTRLFDLETDYAQQRPLADVPLEARCIGEVVAMMAATDAPPEQYARLGLPTPEQLARDPAAARRACVTA
jgi:arylsulfatase A-like enzyme